MINKCFKKHYIIDTHTHIGALPNIVFTGEMAVEIMKENQVDKTIAIRMIEGGGGPFGATQINNPYNGNDYISMMQKKFPEQIIGFGMIDFFDQDTRSFGWKPGSVNLVSKNHAVKELERCILQLDLHGLFMHPDFQGYATNNFFLVKPILDKLVQLQKTVNRQLPVLIHGVGNNIHYVVPEQIGELAEEYPDLIFITSELGWMLLFDSMVKVAKKHENLYLELMVMVDVLSKKRCLYEIGAHRLTLGTDAPWGSYQLGQKMVEEITNNEEEAQLILGGNIARILGC